MSRGAALPRYSMGQAGSRCPTPRVYSRTVGTSLSRITSPAASMRSRATAQCPSQGLGSRGPNQERIFQICPRSVSGGRRIVRDGAAGQQRGSSLTGVNLVWAASSGNGCKRPPGGVQGFDNPGYLDGSMSCGAVLPRNAGTVLGRSCKRAVAVCWAWRAAIALHHGSMSRTGGASPRCSTSSRDVPA